MNGQSVIFLFVDGIGLGDDDPGVNPFAAEGRYSALEKLAGGPLTRSGINETAGPDHLVKPIDANLGMPGLPQSGTGQATIFTGVNCAELAGRHYGPFPHSTSKSVIAKQNIFKRVLEAGGTAQFANAYPERFFTYVERTDRWTVTTLCCLRAGIELKTGDDLEAGRAVSADITGENWPEPWREIVPVSPFEAGMCLTRLLQESDFTLFEYFATDKAGHSMDPDRAATVLSTLDGFVAGILDSLDTERQSLVVTSDHGNLEDLSVKTHTRNKVPLIVYGPAADSFRGVEDLTGLAEATLAAVGAGPPADESPDLSGR